MDPDIRLPSVGKILFGRELWRRDHVFAADAPPIATLRSPMPASYKEHRHDFLEIALVANGQGYHCTARGRQPICRGDVYILWPGAWHTYDNCRHLLLLNCCLGHELLRRELAWLADDPILNTLLWVGPMSRSQKGTMAVHLGEYEFQKCRKSWGRLHRVCHDPKAGSVRRVGSLLEYLDQLARGSAGTVRKLFPTTPRTHPAVHSAIRAMEEDIARAWNLADLAETSHINPAYLVRLFKAHTGLPPLGYLTRCRAERAAALLSKTDLSIKQVAVEVGWSDPNHFARRFRACLGLSASEYRGRLRTAR